MTRSLWSLVFFNGIEGERKCVVHSCYVPTIVYIIDVVNQSKIARVEVPSNY